MSNALQSGMVLEDIVMNALHSDRGPLSGSCIQQPGIDALRQAVADLKWCENIAIRGLACFYCGTDVQHNTAKCPRVMNRCFKCGVPGHSRQSCTEDRIIPENFCCRCLLPLWTLYEDYKVQQMASPRIMFPRERFCRFTMELVGSAASSLYRTLQKQCSLCLRKALFFQEFCLQEQDKSNGHGFSKVGFLEFCHSSALWRRHVPNPKNSEIDIHYCTRCIL